MVHAFLSAWYTKNYITQKSPEPPRTGYLKRLLFIDLTFSVAFVSNIFVLLQDLHEYVVDFY